MDEDEPVAVYSGAEMESMFLIGLLEASGIHAWLANLSFKGDVDARVMVRRRDAEDARVLADDFRKHGRKTGR